MTESGQLQFLCSTVAWAISYHLHAAKGIAQGDHNSQKLC